MQTNTTFRTRNLLRKERKENLQDVIMTRIEGYELSARVYWWVGSKPISPLGDKFVLSIIIQVWEETYFTLSVDAARRNQRPGRKRPLQSTRKRGQSTVTISPVTVFTIPSQLGGGPCRRAELLNSNCMGVRKVYLVCTTYNFRRKIIISSLCRRLSHKKRQKIGKGTTKSAYDFFYDQKCPELKNTDPKLSIVELGTICGMLWKVRKIRAREREREQRKSEREREREERQTETETDSSEREVGVDLLLFLLPPPAAGTFQREEKSLRDLGPEC
jgi:hypothetical protein